MVGQNLIKRCSSAGNTAVANATWTDISIDIPIDVTRGMGISIWALEIEAALGYLIADGLIFKAILARNAITAERYLTDADVLDKIHLEGQIAGAAGTWCYNNVQRREYYPAVPYVGNKLHVGVYQNSTGTLRVDVRVWWSINFISQREMFGMMSNYGVS